MFGYFLMLIAVTIAGVAGYFSVYGLAHIFAGAFWSVIVMGGVLEVGKIVGTTFLYRYWSKLGFLLKTYLLVAIFGLMLITSAGIFGYLSNAYQQDIIGVKDIAARIELLDTELTALTDRDGEINADIARIGSNYVTARQNIMKQYAPEREALTHRIAEIRKEQLQLSTSQLEIEAHTGPIIYIAKAMGKGIDEAVLWMILLIIFVFDPLAIALTVGANVVLVNRAKDRKLEKQGIDQQSSEAGLTIETLETKLTQRETEIADAKKLITIQYGEIEDLTNQLEQLSNQSSDEPNESDAELATEINRLDALVEQLQKATEQKAQELADAEAEKVNALEIIEEQTKSLNALVTDNQRLDDQTLMLSKHIEKRDMTIAQLKDAIMQLEQQKDLTIVERQRLHEHNKTAAKQHQPQISNYE